MTNYEAFLHWVYNSVSPAKMNRPRSEVIADYPGRLTPEERAFLLICTVATMRAELQKNPEDYRPDREFTVGGGTPSAAVSDDTALVDAAPVEATTDVASTDMATNITSPYIIFVYP